MAPDLIARGNANHSRKRKRFNNNSTRDQSRVSEVSTADCEAGLQKVRQSTSGGESDEDDVQIIGVKKATHDPEITRVNAVTGGGDRELGARLLAAVEAAWTDEEEEGDGEVEVAQGVNLSGPTFPSGVG